MNRITILLVTLSLIFGGMIGYSLAFGRIYKQIQEQEQLAKIIPKETTPVTPKIDFSPSAQSFSKVIRQSTGQSVLPLDSASQPVLDAITKAADLTLARMNAPDSPLLGLRRINEGSRFFEDSLQELLDAEADLSCNVPLTQQGTAQRSGYPDLVITHHPSGRTYYLDPKLTETTSRESSLRTFYYTPRSETSKILKNAHHLVIGFEHDGSDGAWDFKSWSLVDLSKVKLTLKSEYNASNRDLYTEEAVVIRQ